MKRQCNTVNKNKIKAINSKQKCKYTKKQRQEHITDGQGKYNNIKKQLRT